MSEPVDQCVIVPPEAAREVRQRLGLAAESALRIAYIAGPGDAVGTFDQWLEGSHDKRTPVIAYSTMFYTLVAALKAEALILVEQDRQPAVPDPRFQFTYTEHPRGRRGLGYRRDEAAFTRSVLDKLANWPADIVLVGTDAPAQLIARLPDRPRIVLTAHNVYWPMGQRPTSLRSRFRLWRTSQALRRIASAVCTSGECASQIVALGGDPTRMLVETPQVLPEFFAPPRSRASCARLLYLGRIEANKGVLDLIDAFDAVATEIPGLSLDIAGTGSADAALQSRVAASTNSARIKIHGLLAAREVHSLLHQSDLLICPTRIESGEGLALVVIEAAVHGVPAVVSSIVPAKDLLPGACLAFPANDTNALAARLRELAKSPKTYAAICAALEPAREQFRNRSVSWGSMLYRALVA